MQGRDNNERAREIFAYDVTYGDMEIEPEKMELKSSYFIILLIMTVVPHGDLRYLQYSQQGSDNEMSATCVNPHVHRHVSAVTSKLLDLMMTP